MEEEDELFMICHFPTTLSLGPRTCSPAFFCDSPMRGKRPHDPFFHIHTIIDPLPRPDIAVSYARGKEMPKRNGGVGYAKVTCDSFTPRMDHRGETPFGYKTYIK